jgi:hypothetical protein
MREMLIAPCAKRERDLYPLGSLLLLHAQEERFAFVSVAAYLVVPIVTSQLLLIVLSGSFLAF